MSEENRKPTAWEVFSKMSWFEKSEITGTVVTIVTMLCKAAIEIAKIHAGKKEVKE